MNEPREQQKVKPPLPSDLEGKSLGWWLKQLSPPQIKKLILSLVVALVLSFNIGAWIAGLYLPFLKDLPWFPGDRKTEQRALYIDGVDLGLDSVNRPEQKVRILAVVNGSAKGYPTDGGWAPPSPDFSTEPFAVTEAQAYSIRFEVFAKDACDAITRFVAPSAHTVNARDLPAKKLKLRLHEEDSEGPVVGTVRFSIE